MMSNIKETLELALEALENSIDLVSHEARNAEELYGKYPSRLARIQGLVAFEVAHEKAITALREALASQGEALAEQPAPVAKPHEQEPVAWMVDVDLANYQGQSEYRTILAWNAKPIWSGTHEINEVLKAVPLYTSPPTLSLAQRTWVGLTDEEVITMSRYDLEYAALIGEVQRKLREKNSD